MKKIYLLAFFTGFGFLANAQNDLSVTLNNYNAGEATSDDPLDMVFTITNESTSPVATADTIYFGFLVGTMNYSINLMAGSVSYIILNADLAAGASINLATLTTPPATMSMQWIYDELSGLTGTICAFAGVGEASLSATPGADANYLDNTMCVDYTVTEVAGLEQVGASFLQVFPNPASDVVHFQVGNNEISQINVYDLNGRLIESINVSGTTEIVDTRDLNGVYYCQFLNGDQLIATEKFVVTN